MENLQSILLILLVLDSAALIALILMQHGKGADAGAAFGSGASSTVFGASGASNFLSRSTAYLAVVFFALALSLAYLASNRASVDSVTTQGFSPAPVETDSSSLPESDVLIPDTLSLPPAASPEIGSDLPPVE